MSAWQPDAETTRLIRKYALQNALEYDGKGEAGSVQGRILGEVPELRPHAKHLFALLGPAVEEANLLREMKGADAVRALLAEEAPDALEKRVKKRREGLPDLAGAEMGGVVLRFAPNPNGPLTLGHSRGVIINSQYAEMYEGKVILRYDDTDTKIKRPDLEAYDWIREEFVWLTGREPDITIEASSRMPEYLAHAERFITANHMYVCTCSAELFKEFRINREECPCRARTVAENQELWGEMQNREGDLVEGSAVVRVRTDMTHNNPALRDWPAWRIQRTPHPKVGERYRVWPLLDFQSAVEDHLQGVTHIIRGKDLMDSTRKQELLYEMVGWTYPETLYWGRVKVHEFGGFSTSQMRMDIVDGLYEGWDDPRLPTVRALRRRGFSAEAFRRFWSELSLTQKDISVPLDTLISHNSSVIDETSPRLSFISDPVRITIDSNEVEIPDFAEIPRHPLHQEMGSRNWPLSTEGGLEVFIERDDFQAAMRGDGLVRLKDFCDIQLNVNQPEKLSGEITSLARTDGRAIIHWLAAGMETDATLLKASEDGASSEDGLRRIIGLLERHDHPHSTVVQLERMGFAIIEDSPSDGLCNLVWSHG